MSLNFVRFIATWAKEFSEQSFVFDPINLARLASVRFFPLYPFAVV